MAEANADNAVPEEPSIGGFVKYVARGGSLAKKGAVPPPAKKAEDDSAPVTNPSGEPIIGDKARLRAIDQQAQ